MKAHLLKYRGGGGLLGDARAAWRSSPLPVRPEISVRTSIYQIGGVPLSNPLGVV
jgi:hypothetical protein